MNAHPSDIVAMRSLPAPILSIIVRKLLLRDRIRLSNTCERFRRTCHPFLVVPVGTVTILPAVYPEERREIHRYLEVLFPRLPKTSLRIRGLRALKKMILWPCDECDKKIPMYYRRGWAENNEDESYCGYCHRCDIPLEWEPNYDPHAEVTVVWANNAVAIGTYFKGYQIPSHARRLPQSPTTTTTKRLLPNVDIVTVDEPAEPISEKKKKKKKKKEDVQNYLSSAITPRTK